MYVRSQADMLTEHSGAAAVLLPHSNIDLGSIVTNGAVCTEIVRSPCDRVGFLQVHRFLPTLQRRTGLQVN